MGGGGFDLGAWLWARECCDADDSLRRVTSLDTPLLEPEVTAEAAATFHSMKDSSSSDRSDDVVDEECNIPERTMGAPNERTIDVDPTATSSWFPNMLFLVGSGLYVWLAIWDLRQLDKTTESLDDDSTAASLPGFWSLYMAVSALAASCYVLVAILQIFPCDGRLFTGTKSNVAPGAVSIPEGASEASWCMGLTFGCGAILDLVSAVSGTMRDQHCTNLTAWGAAHLYLANAVILVCFTRHGRAKRETLDNQPTTITTDSALESSSTAESTQAMTLAEQTEMLGDYLFLVGSLVDVSLCYFYFEENSAVMWKYIYMGNFVTSVLWLIDSGLYIAADLLAIRENDVSSQVVDPNLGSTEVDLGGDDIVAPLLIHSSP